MANRRMFSLEIVGSDAFLDMPSSTRDLYFHLGMYADDEGFVNPKKIMRIVGASDDDLKVLIGKRFLLSFASGVVVVKHWKMNNYLQSDRTKKTSYTDEKTLIFTKENGSYTECIQNVHVDKIRLDKYITPIGDRHMKYQEQVIERNELGDEVEVKNKRQTFGKYPVLIAKHYCTLLGKTDGGRQLPAAKKLLEITQTQYPDDTIEQWSEEIIKRIDVAKKYYEKIKKVDDWNLSKVCENWDLIASKWFQETKKYQ